MIVRLHTIMGPKTTQKDIPVTKETALITQKKCPALIARRTPEAVDQMVISPAPPHQRQHGALATEARSVIGLSYFPRQETSGLEVAGMKSRCPMGHACVEPGVYLMSQTWYGFVNDGRQGLAQTARFGT